MIKHYKIFANPSSHNLPSAYQEVEYLESNGAQWINTGLYPPMYGKVEAKFKFNAITQKATVWGVALPRCYVGYEESITIGWWGIYWRTGVLPDTSTIYNSLLTMNGNNATVTINGNTSSGSATATTYADTMFLFARNSGGSPSNNSRFNGRIYTFVVTDDTLGQICNVVPCYRKSDSVAGMYDLVSNTFLTNSGTGSFIVGPDVSSTILIPTYKRAYILNNTKISTYKSARVLSRLPSAYQEVEYLESTGTQWINTGILPRWGISGKIKFNQSQADTYMTPFGCRSQYFVPIRFASTYQWEIYYGNTRLRFGNVPSTLNTDFVAEFTTESGKQITTVGDQSVEINDTYVFTTPITCALFGSNNNNAVYRPWIGRIYYCELNFDGEPTRNLIPCYRKSDSVAGMYDLVSKTFFTNSGTGSFIVGPNTNIIIS